MIGIGMFDYAISIIFLINFRARCIYEKYEDAIGILVNMNVMS